MADKTIPALTSVGTLTTGYMFPVALSASVEATRSSIDILAISLSDNFFSITSNTPVSSDKEGRLYGRFRNFTSNVLISGSDLKVEGGVTTSGLNAGHYKSHTLSRPQFYSTIAGGSGITNAGLYSFVGGGRDNSISLTTNDYCVIVGGYQNASSSDDTFMGGGIQNTIGTTATDSTLVGGYLNTVGNGVTAGFIGGGQSNDIAASAIYSTVVGGFTNSADGNYSFIGGGDSNAMDSATTNGTVVGGHSNTLVNGDYSFIGGGNINNINSNHSVIGGGYNNVTNSSYSTIGGGYQNTTNSPTALGANTISVIVGGQGNTTNDIYNFIGGGFNNGVTGDGAIVVGGQYNYVTGNYSVIGGGNYNLNRVAYGTIGGGFLNIINPHDTFGGNSYSFIGGGRENTTHNYQSVICGGIYNSSSGIVSSILGGENNSCTGARSSILGGYYNTISGADYALVAGTRSVARHNGSFVLSDSRQVSHKHSFDQDSITFCFQRGAFFSGTDIRTSGGNIYVNGDIISTSQTAPTVTYKGPGIIYYACEPSGNLAGTETLLQKYTLPANTLKTNGDRLKIHAAGKNLGGAGSNYLTLAFGGSGLGDSTIGKGINRLAVGGTDVRWQIDAEIIRSGASMIRWNDSWTNTAAADNSYWSDYSNRSLTANQIISISGNGASANDIIVDSMTVEYWPM